MSNEQLELDFGVPDNPDISSQNVVDLQTFRRQREAREAFESKKTLVEEILRSVEHLTGRSKDLEVM